MGHRLSLRVRILSFEPVGLIVKPRFGRQFTVAYAEVLTAERLRRAGLRLHTRTTDPLRVRVRMRERAEAEAHLRRRGVRIIDGWGAIIAPTLLDFEEELARGPERVRQSSDDA